MYDFLFESPQSWEDVLYEVFDTGIPGKAEWHDSSSICRILNAIGPATCLVTPATAVAEPRLLEAVYEAATDHIILRFTECSRSIRPQKLYFCCREGCYEQSYFRLKTPEETTTPAYLFIYRETAERLKKEDALLPLPALDDDQLSEYLHKIG